jgi:hypothetical protein
MLKRFRPEPNSWCYKPEVKKLIANFQVLSPGGGHTGTISYVVFVYMTLGQVYILREGHVIDAAAVKPILPTFSSLIPLP